MAVYYYGRFFCLFDLFLLGQSDSHSSVAVVSIEKRGRLVVMSPLAKVCLFVRVVCVCMSVTLHRQKPVSDLENSQEEHRCLVKEYRKQSLSAPIEQETSTRG